MKNRQLGLLALAVCAALVIAIFLQEAVEQLIIRPAAYLLWWLGIFYRFIPQPVLWFLLVLGMLYLTLGSLAEKLHWPGRKPKNRVTQGPVEEFAAQIERRPGGIFFKWQIARTLSEIALDVQELRQHVRRRQLDFDEAAVSPPVRRFLEAGLNTSFSDYPLQGGLPLPAQFRTLPPTPFDLDLEPVIAYLESQLEHDDDFKRP